MAYERSESTRESFGKFIHQFLPETKILIKKLERILIQLYGQNVSLLSNIYIYIYISWSRLNFLIYIDCYLMILQSSCSFAVLETYMTDKLSEDGRYYLICYLKKVFEHCHVSFHNGQRFEDFMANDASGIISPQRKSVLISSDIILHVINVSNFRLKNTDTNIIPPSKFLNLRDRHSSLSQLLLKAFMIFRSLLKWKYILS